MIIPDPVTRNLFFTGKGGVGKTSVACATAVGLADAGRRVLLVSTDPASNLDEVFGVELGTTPTPVPGVPGLSAMNIDPEAAARAYRERMVGPYRGLLPDASIRSMEEQFSGACTVEIAAFDEFSRLLGDPDGDRRVRSRPLRHGADRAHAPAAQAPGRLDGLLRGQRRGELVPRAALGARHAARPVRIGPGGALRSRDDHARARHAGRSDGAPRGGPHERRALEPRHQEPAAGRERPLHRDRPHATPSRSPSKPAGDWRSSRSPKTSPRCRVPTSRSSRSGSSASTRCGP